MTVHAGKCEFVYVGYPSSHNCICAHQSVSSKKSVQDVGVLFDRKHLQAIFADIMPIGAFYCGSDPLSVLPSLSCMSMREKKGKHTFHPPVSLQGYHKSPQTALRVSEEKHKQEKKHTLMSGHCGCFMNGCSGFK